MSQQALSREACEDGEGGAAWPARPNHRGLSLVIKRLSRARLVARCADTFHCTARTIK